MADVDVRQGRRQRVPDRRMDRTVARRTRRQLRPVQGGGDRQRAAAAPGRCESPWLWRSRRGDSTSAVRTNSSNLRMYTAVKQFCGSAMRGGVSGTTRSPPPRRVRSRRRRPWRRSSRRRSPMANWSRQLVGRGAPDQRRPRAARHRHQHRRASTTTRTNRRITPIRWRDLNAGLQAFFAALSPTFRSRVTMMTYSEFGRTPWSNESLGTDHGTANVALRHRRQREGRRLRRSTRRCSRRTDSRSQQWDRIELRRIDFRSMYATMIDGVLGGGSTHGARRHLRQARPVPPTTRRAAAVVARAVVVARAAVARRRAPSSSASCPPACSTPAMEPVCRLGRPSSITLRCRRCRGRARRCRGGRAQRHRGRAQRPSSFVTVWPTGVDRPGTSSLNVAGGDVVPNLVHCQARHRWQGRHLQQRRHRALCRRRRRLLPERHRQPLRLAVAGSRAGHA